MIMTIKHQNVSENLMQGCHQNIEQNFPDIHFNLYKITFLDFPRFSRFSSGEI